MRNLIRSGLAGTLLGVLALAAVAHAQDSTTLLAQAATLNQTFVTQTESALQAPDLATSQTRTRAVIATGQQLAALLTEARDSATDDATRSRAQGLLDHVQAALAAAQRALAETSLDAAHSDLEAVRGEAVEALSEVRPFAQAPVSVLPVTGGPGPSDLFSAAAVGLGLTLAGLGLRRTRLA